MKYRPDIDGLRAVAVVPVVLYHLGGGHIVPGGYVGVDIFFVISGYLITQLISAEMHAGRYSIAGFYARRARRIFPALFVMCAIYLALVVRFYVPDEVDTFRRSLIATTFFFSNIYFYFTQGYFSPAAVTKPLLHTWSLAVEEQYYIGFPIVLLLVRRYCARREKPILMGLALLSLLSSAWLVWSDPPAAFYLPQSRAWELLLGSLLAIGAWPAVRKAASAEVLGALGLTLIAVSVFFYRNGTPFPGLAALTPCIGAALVIHSGAHCVPSTSRLLAIAPLRFIGLISYSLYLWHWPVYIAANYFFERLNALDKVAMLLVSVVLATLSWHFIEKPFRRKPYRLAQRHVLSAGAAAMVVLAVLAVVSYPLSFKIWKLPADAQKILALLDYDQDGPVRAGSCFLSAAGNDFALFNEATCLHMSAAKKNYLLLGDSHAADLWAGFARVNPDVNILQATASECKPLLNGTGSRACTALMQFMFKDFLPKHHLDAILLSGRWRPEDIQGLESSTAALKPYASRVIIFGPSVEYRHPLPRTVVLGMIKHDPSLVARDRVAAIKETDQLFAERFRAAGIEYFSVYRAICPAECQVLDSERMPIEFDTAHFTVKGSIYVAERAHESGVM